MSASGAKRVAKASIALVLWALLGPMASSGASAEERFIILASTTSTENSGLLEAILPLFEAKSGIEVRVVAVRRRESIQGFLRCV